MIEVAMKAGAARILAKTRREFAMEAEAERAAVAEAIASKGQLHPAYWQRRFAAEQRMRAAEQIVAALTQMDEVSP